MRECKHSEYTVWDSHRGKKKAKSFGFILYQALPFPKPFLGRGVEGLVSLHLNRKRRMQLRRVLEPSSAKLPDPIARATLLKSCSLTRVRGNKGLHYIRIIFRCSLVTLYPKPYTDPNPSTQSSEVRSCSSHNRPRI